jgi:phage-related protein
MKFDIDFTFNGISSQEMGLYNVKVGVSEVTHMFNAAKQITTTKPLYGNRNIITAVNTEPLTFSLTFTAMDKGFSKERIREIFSYFDVTDYTPLSFQENPDFYFNVMPMTSQQDLYLFEENDQGYFSIDFVCDCGHGWISRHYTIECNQNTMTQIVDITNESNVKNEEGNYKVYPYMIIQDHTAAADSDYSRFVNLFTDKMDNQATTDYVADWFLLRGYTPGSKIEIDNNTLYTNSSVGDLIIPKLLFPTQGGNGLVYNTGKGFYLGPGVNRVRRRLLVVDDVPYYPNYTLDLYFDFPVME